MDTKPIHILAVEDREDDINVLRRAFDSAKILNSITVVRSGREALDYLERTMGDTESELPQPDLLILDLGLPDIGGLDVLRALRADERFRTLSVIVLTVSDTDEDIIGSYDLGVQAFIQKPVRLHNLNDYFLSDERFAFVVTRR